MPGKSSDRKTTATAADADSLLTAVADERRRADAQQALELMRSVTGADPVVWGSSIIGFGRRSYTTSDGKEHDWFVVGLAARKAYLSFYGLTFYGSNADLLDRLGPHSIGKGCVYVKRYDEIDPSILAELVTREWEATEDAGD